MEIEDTWMQIEESDFILKNIISSDLNSLSSKAPLKKLKKSLYNGVLWGCLFNIVYVFICVYYNIGIVYLLLFTVISFNSWLIISGYKLHSSIKENIDSNNSLLLELQKNYYSITKWGALQEKVSLFIYPFEVTGGFILGGILGSGKSPEILFSKNIFILALIAAIIILVPISYLLARKLFRISYGKHLKKIKLIIDEFSSS